MAIKITTEATVVEWPTLCGEVCERFPYLRAIFAPVLENSAGDNRVLRLKIPYGTPLIHDGKFCWDSLPPEYSTWRDEYGDTSIPLCVVLRRCVELHEISTTMGHAVPLHLAAEGELFGLFQNFCHNFLQRRLQGSAGGTSLIFLPPLGNQEAIKQFARKKKWATPWDAYHEGLKSTAKSHFHFGRFFKDILAQVPSAWRAEIVLFSKAMVDQIKADSAAHRAALEVALEQMRGAVERAEEAAEILGDDTVGNTGHVLALRMIARGLRPGFSPVFGSDADLNVLPADDLHRLFYGDQLLPEQGEPAPADSAPEPGEPPLLFPKASEFYPALFRPSLKGEPSFYFLNWPYVQPRNNKDTVASIAGRAVAKAKEAEVGRARSDMFETIDPADVAGAIARLMEADRARTVTVSASPDRNYFLRGGVVMIRPPKELSGSPT